MSLGLRDFAGGLWDWIKRDLKFTDAMLALATVLLAWATYGLWSAAAHSDEAFQVQKDTMQKQLDEMKAARVASSVDTKKFIDNANEQLNALKSQASAMERQSEISGKLLAASQLQLSATRELAIASSNQARSSQRLAELNDQQYRLQNFAYFESQRARISVEFSNAEMVANQRFEYDLANPIHFYATYHNTGIDSAAVFSRIQVRIVEGNTSILPEFCPTFNCDGGSPINVGSGISKVAYRDFTAERSDYYSDGKDWFLVVIAQVDYRDLVQRINDHRSACMSYSFRTKLWKVCGEPNLAN
jgi:hypothetical protein